MRAVFAVSANGTDITELLKDRILEIRITDRPGMESDECEIKIDDRDAAVAIPPKGATLRVSLGWAGKPLTDFGAYVIDEIRVSGGPRTMTLSGKPADLRGGPKSHRSMGYENTTLADIVKQIAARHGWEGYCTITANVPREDQLGESDLHFVTRLARKYGGTATVKDGKLLVLPRAAGKSATGKDLPAVALTPGDVFPGWEIVLPDRAAVGAVKTRTHDSKTGAKAVVTLPNPNAAPKTADAVHVDRHDHPSPDAAKAAAKARLESLNRLTATATLSMWGRGDLSAEMPVRLSGFKVGADGEYLAESVTQTYQNGGWITAVELNAGNTGKAQVGQSKRTGGTSKPTSLVLPDA